MGLLLVSHLAVAVVVVTHTGSHARTHALTVGRPGEWRVGDREKGESTATATLLHTLCYSYLFARTHARPRTHAERNIKDSTVYYANTRSHASKHDRGAKQDE